MQVGPGSNEQFIINTTYSPPVCGGVRSQQGDLLEVGALLVVSLIPWHNGFRPAPCWSSILNAHRFNLCALEALNPPSVIHRESSTIHHPPSIIHHPSSIIHHPSSVIHHPSVHHPSSTVNHPSSIIHHPSSIILHPSSMQRLRTCICLFVSSFFLVHSCVNSFAIEGNNTRARSMTTGADDEYCRSSTQDTSQLRWKCLTEAALTHKGAFLGISLFTLS